MSRSMVAVVAFAVAWSVFSASAPANSFDDQQMTAAGKPAEGALESFLGEPQFELKDLFTGDRFPSVLVTTDGTVLALWGASEQRWLRRSEDGGQTWESAEEVPVPMPYPPNVVVDENTGDIMFLSLETADDLLWRSTDQGKTWQEETIVIKPNAVLKWIEQARVNTRVSLEGIMRRDDGYWLRTSLGEPGITLRHGENKGRILMYGAFRPHSTVHPSDRWKVAPDKEVYAFAVYSDDGGQTWQIGGFFPEGSSEEAAIVELQDGRLYFNSRSHRGYGDRSRAFDIPQKLRMRRTAWSCDGGETWENLGISQVLFDGGGYDRGYGMMGGLERLPVEGRDILLFSNVDTGGGIREKMTVWASFDGGETWPVKRLVYSGPSAYNSMTAGRPETPSEGWVYLQFEGGTDHRYEGCKIARFNLAWVLEGELTGDGQIPDWVAP